MLGQQRLLLFDMHYMVFFSILHFSMYRQWNYSSQNIQKQLQLEMLTLQPNHFDILKNISIISNYYIFR